MEEAQLEPYSNPSCQSSAVECCFSIYFSVISTGTCRKHCKLIGPKEAENQIFCFQFTFSTKLLDECILQKSNQSFDLHPFYRGVRENIVIKHEWDFFSFIRFLWFQHRT